METPRDPERGKGKLTVTEFWSDTVDEESNDIRHGDCSKSWVRGTRSVSLGRPYLSMYGKLTNFCEPPKTKTSFTYFVYGETERVTYVTFRDLFYVPRRWPSVSFHFVIVCLTPS